MQTMQLTSQSIQGDQVSSYLVLDVTHSHMTRRFAEIKFDGDMPLSQIKDQLENRIGTSVADQSLTLKNCKNELVAQMNDDLMTLHQYGAQNGYLIHITDNNSHAVMGQWDDVSKVEKYVMSDVDYDKKEDTYRNFRKRQIALNPNFKDYEGQPDRNW